MAGYLWVRQGPPKLSCVSSTTKLVTGTCVVRWYAAPTPEMPAPAMTTSKCSVPSVAAGSILLWTFIGVALRCSPLHFPPAQKRQPLEQMHVLLVLQQRAVQRRDQLSRIALAQHFRRHVLVEQEFQPVQQLRS